MLHREIIAVCSQIHTKHINTLCGENVEFVNVKFSWYKKKPLDFKWLLFECHYLGSVLLYLYCNL